MGRCERWNVPTHLRDSSPLPTQPPFLAGIAGDQSGRPPVPAAAAPYRTAAAERLLVVVARRNFELAADVVEPAAGRPEAGVDLVELGGVERRAEARQALAVVEP